MPSRPALVYLDAYLLGDPLFVSGLARDLAERQKRGGGGVVLVHGAGEAGERAVEATGADVRHAAGALVTTEATAPLVERAARELNRQIVHELNESGVSAVRVVGADRGLLKPGPEGAVAVGKSGWIGTLARSGACVVVLAMGDAGAPALTPLDPVRSAGALSKALRLDPVVWLVGGRRLPGSGPSGSGEALDPQRLSDATPALRRMPELVADGVAVCIAPVASLREGGVPDGLRIGGEEAAR